MAHFAQLDENDQVINVIVVDNDVILEPDGTENESKGIAYLEGICGSNYRYVQTSINANFRGEYAIIGGKYDRENDVFIGDGFIWN